MRKALWLVVPLALFAAACSSDSADSDETLSVVNINILHGVTCEEGSDSCAAPERVALFLEQLDDAGCPDLVTVQEVNPPILELFEEGLPDTCDGDYEVVWHGDEGVDRELVLSQLPVVDSELLRLAGPLRSAYWVQVTSELGPVDVVTTHLASSSDNTDCNPDTCPPPCEPDTTVQTCQAVQIADFLEAKRDPNGISLLTGDLNATVAEPTIDVIAERGWLDSHLEAGNPECDPDTGEECTSGRFDDGLDDLTDPESTQTERIDYIWLVPPSTCEPVFDRSEGSLSTGLFNAEPEPDGPSGLAFPSDHTGVALVLACPPIEGATEVTETTGDAAATTTTEAPAGIDDPAAVEEITAAFEAFFDGTNPDLESKLALLEGGEGLREAFYAGQEANAELAVRTTASVDQITITSPTTAVVTYTIRLDDLPTLPDQPGGAILVDGRWLLTADTYCDVAELGGERPAACP